VTKQQEPATLRDVARVAGVNVGTASRALSEDRRDMVSPETLKRVEGAARELDYKANPIARGLKTSKTFSIGVLVPDLTNPLYPPIIRGIDDVLSRASYTPLIANTDNDQKRERKGFEALQGRRVDGFVIASAFREHPLVEEAIAAGIPLVLSLRRIDAGTAWTVCVDEHTGIGEAVAHLASLGHRRIAHIGGPVVMSTAQERYLGFIAAMTRLGEASIQDLVQLADGFSIESGRRACLELLDRDVDPTAITAGNDLIALGCIDALAERGLSCPEDVSVIGYNDMPLADRLTPALTTVRIPHYELGVRSAEVLLDRITGGGSVSRTEMLTPKLIVRKSTRPL
jgi:LacI family transcriptional regulator, galactose operon repressor